MNTLNVVFFSTTSRKAVKKDALINNHLVQTTYVSIDQCLLTSILALDTKKSQRGFFFKSFQSMIKVCNKIIYIYIKAEALIT